MNNLIDTDVVSNSSETESTIFSPISVAQAYVHNMVQAPALASNLAPGIKSKVKHSDLWLSKFTKVGDLFTYLKRFELTHDDPIYRAMKECGLQTFEDILTDFNRKFEHWSGQRSTILDFVVGQAYSVFDILILAQNYDTRAGGMFVLESGGLPAAVVIKATLTGGRYANEWLVEDVLLKYYLKSINGNFSEKFKANQAILANKDIPIAAFVRLSTDSPFIFKGIFRYDEIIREADGAKAFRLRRRLAEESGLVTAVDFVTSELTRGVKDSLNSSATDRLRRLAEAPKIPSKISIIATAYRRNPDVIVEVLSRADGNCECCHMLAPFLRRSDNSGYLEVHHKIQLSAGGEDTVQNAIALCPNCHREQHFGKLGMVETDHHEFIEIDNFGHNLPAAGEADLIER